MMPTAEKQLTKMEKWRCIPFRTTHPNYQTERPWNPTRHFIWRMAGGADTDEEYCSDDDYYLVLIDTAVLKRRLNIQDST
jgi:hypothetical protein